MRVKLLARWATPDFSHGEGTVVDLDEAQARQLVADSFAEPVDPLPAAPPDAPGKPARVRKKGNTTDPAAATVATDPAAEAEATTPADPETPAEGE